MPAYRLYTIRDDHIREPPRFFDAASDENAIKKAKGFLDGADLELWLGERRVVTLGSRDKE